MFVERMLPAARKRLVTIGDDAPLIDAAKLVGVLHTDLVVVCSSDEMLAGDARDALEVLLEEVEYEERLLREYVMCVGYH